MIIDCISDLHGHFPKLEGGDLLIIAGDLTAADLPYQYELFFEWLKNQKYRKKIFISGNHDNQAMSQFDWFDAEYLFDSGTEFEGLKVLGSPWTTKFIGINPKCCAFTVDHDNNLIDKFEKIPNDVDILITHSPAHLVLDKIKPRIQPRLDIQNHVGSSYLHGALKYRFRPKLHVCGHIHEAYGQVEHFSGCISVNASLVNEHYEHVNKPIRIIL